MSVSNEKIDLLEDEYVTEDTQKDRYLSFKIGNEEYAIEITHVIEIIGIQKITKVPNIKNYIKGIISLRGVIIPVVEVRTRFGFETIDYNERTCIIVIKYGNSDIGLIVDEVQEVVTIPENQIEISPLTSKGNQGIFIAGIGKVGNSVKMILNIERLLFDENDVFVEDEEENS